MSNYILCIFLEDFFFSGDSFCALMGVKKERGTTEGGMRQEESKRKPVREASPNSMWIS